VRVQFEQRVLLGRPVANISLEIGVFDQGLFAIADPVLVEIDTTIDDRRAFVDTATGSSVAIRAASASACRSCRARTTCASVARASDAE
jgi:hypothetical protein